MKKSYLLILLLAAFSSLLHAKVIYVDIARPATGAINGNSWATAWPNVQTAIDSSKAGDSIWVAKGTYYHYYNSSAFAMKDSVKVYGGFLNTHTKFSDRDWSRNFSILRGNGYIVILNSFLEAVGPEAVLDGFTVSGGTKGGMENSFSSPTISNCTFISNTYTTGPAAMQNSACSSVITNCQFIGNTGTTAVTNAGFGAFPPANEAGPTFIDCTFSTNSGTNAGGVTSSGCIVSFRNCDFYGNKSSLNGAGLAASYAIVNVANCRFTSNEAAKEGGGIYLDKCISTITGCTFSKNIADFGGGIAHNSDTSIRYMTLTDCIFDGNEAIRPRGTYQYASTERSGGGLYNRGRATISDCIFRNNLAGFANATAGGGGMYCYFRPNDPVSTITNCRFYANGAIDPGTYYYWGTEASGGGAYVAFGNLTNCVFEDNMGFMYGGGLTVFGNGRSGIVDGCRFLRNKSGFGGGLLATSVVKIVNSLIANNKADSSGGGIHFEAWQGTDGNFINNTVTGNWARRGGTMSFKNFGTVTNPVKISNSIMWGNSSGFQRPAAVPAPTVTYSLVQGMAANTASHVLDSSLNPAFVDTAAGIYQLLAASPCRDMGRNDSLPAVFNTDLLGKTRIYNSTVDMGAFEYGIHAPVATLGRDTTLCSNIRLRLRIPYQNGSDVLWSTGDTTVWVNVLTPGIYHVTVTNALGTASDTIDVKHFVAPVVNLGNDTGTCNRLWLDAQNPGSTIRWSNGSGVQRINVLPGTYSVVVTDANLCRATDTIRVAQFPVPVVNLGPDFSFDEGEPVTLDARNAGASYLWSTGETTRMITVDTSGIYSVVVTNPQGCSASGQIEVTMIPSNVGVPTLNATAMLSLYPNPAGQTLTIRVNDPKMYRATMTLLDATGRSVRSFVLEQTEQRLSLEGLAPGVYVLQAGTAHSWKIVKR